MPGNGTPGPGRPRKRPLTEKEVIRNAGLKYKIIINTFMYARATK